ncbi:hypothetical protein ACVXHA_17965 [Escherichia coli]
MKQRYGVPTTGRGVSVDVAAVVFVPAAVLPDISVCRWLPAHRKSCWQRSGMLTDAPPQKWPGRLTRGRQPAVQPAFPVFFAALSRAS